MHKRIAFISVIAVCMIGCTNQNYSTVKTGNGRFWLSGPDPNQLQGNAYKACKDDGFDDYTVVEARKGSLVAQCEKTPKSFTATASDAATKAWDTVKQKVEELRKDATEAKKSE